LKLAESIAGKRLYLATAEALDDEMAKRIKNHKKERGNNWTTIEEPIKSAEVVKKNKKYDVILLDCLTLWISNLMHASAPQSSPQKGEEAKEVPSTLRGEGQGEGKIEKEIAMLISACKRSKANIIIVSNEVGLGIVPGNPLARQFRDIAGYANQKIAQAVDEMYFVTAGIPMRVK
jgi:adenosylcobinamide kinase/adenosylcobinamide-phosphate guanylyltransferase